MIKRVADFKAMPYRSFFATQEERWAFVLKLAETVDAQAGSRSSNAYAFRKGATISGNVMGKAGEVECAEQLGLDPRAVVGAGIPAGDLGIDLRVNGRTIDVKTYALAGRLLLNPDGDKQPMRAEIVAFAHYQGEGKRARMLGWQEMSVIRSSVGFTVEEIDWTRPGSDEKLRRWLVPSRLLWDEEEGGALPELARFCGLEL